MPKKEQRLKCDRCSEEAEWNIGQKHAGLAGQLCDKCVIDLFKSTGVELTRIMDTIQLGRTSKLSEIDAHLYRQNGASRPGYQMWPRENMPLGIQECPSCGGHGSSFCDYCGRCSHCCDKTQCQYGCDFV